MISGSNKLQSLEVLEIHCQRVCCFIINNKKTNNPVAAHLTACWPEPAVLQMTRRSLVEPPWFRYSEERVPDDGNLCPSGPAEEE